MDCPAGMDIWKRICGFRASLQDMQDFRRQKNSCLNRKNPPLLNRKSFMVFHAADLDFARLNYDPRLAFFGAEDTVKVSADGRI